MEKVEGKNLKIHQERQKVLAKKRTNPHEELDGQLRSEREAADEASLCQILTVKIVSGFAKLTDLDT